MKKILFLILVVLMLLLGGCMRYPEDINLSGMPVNITSSENGEVDLDLMIQYAQSAIKEYLPEAEFGGLTIFEDCDCLPSSGGRYVLSFFQTYNRFLRIKPIVYFGSVSVKINENKADIRVWNVSDFYPSTKTFPIPSSSDIERVLSATSSHLDELGISSCEVEITQLEENWYVLCDPLNENERKCEFSVDLDTFQIVE